MTLELRSERERAKGSCPGLGLFPGPSASFVECRFRTRAGRRGWGLDSLRLPDSPWRGTFAFASETAAFWIECQL